MVEFLYSGDTSVFLPPLFRLENYTDCMRRGNIYCAVDAKLKAIDGNSDSWNAIEAFQSVDRFDRTVLHRTLCVPSNETSSGTSLNSYINEVVNNETDHLHLGGTVTDVVCTNGNHSFTTFDLNFMCLFICYMTVILLATFCHILKKIKAQDFLTKFSLLYNWNEIEKVNKDEDHVRLKCMQGIRVVCTILVIVTHSKLFYIFTYVRDPELVENFGYLLKPAAYLDIFIVQVFFLMSSWLLVVKICKVYYKHGKFSMKQLCYLIVNRYFRLAVTLATYAALYKSVVLPYMIKDSASLQLSHVAERACETNCLATFLFYSNFFPLGDVCVASTWYLSADFQLYVLGGLVFYFTFKHKLDIKIVIGCLVIVSLLAYSLMIYHLGLDIIFRVHLRNLERAVLFRSLRFVASYLSTLSSLTTSYVGIVFGLIYYKCKSTTECRKSKLKETLLVLFFFGVPCTVMFISSWEYEGVAAAIVGPFVKPLFAVGVAVGILWMSNGFGGVLRKILESRLFEILGNITYSTYVFHWSICFWKFHKHTLPEVTIIKLVIYGVSTVVLSFLLGLIATLTIELPARHVQKLLIPQCDNKSEKKH